MTTHIEEVIKNKSIVKPLKRMGNAAKQKEAAAAQKESPSSETEPDLIF
jgi:hypothetical protein